MACYACERHHVWRTQTTWTNWILFLIHMCYYSKSYFIMNSITLNMSVNVMKNIWSHISQTFMCFIVAFVLILIFNGPIDRKWGTKLQVWQLLNLCKWFFISFREGFDFAVQVTSIVKYINVPIMPC